MSGKNYYDILGVERSASADDIKRAYRRKALELHPDRNPDRADAEEHFKELSQAYSVLSDPEKRRRYDQFGEAGLGGGPQGFDPSIFQDIFGGSAGFGGIEDLFESFFGGGGRRGRAGGPQRGQSLRYGLEISFEEAAFGTEVSIRVPRTMSCEACHGTGAAEGGVVTCGTCRGTGQVVSQMGFMRIAQTCPSCGGAGQVIRDACKTCRGAGRTEVERTVKVRVPAGVDDGTRLRISGEGNGGARGGPAGDLFVDISVRPHETLVRDGADIHSELNVGFVDLVLGIDTEIGGLEGSVPVQVPAGTEPGATLRLAGKGIPRLSSRGRGDHIVHVVAKPPRKLSSRERELWSELRDLAQGTGQGGSGKAKRKGKQKGSDDGGLLDRVKDIFGGE